ncbi:MAG: amino acid racemase [Clostridiales bacterium]|nr:amino acid racemase [Clostridiales bacterium]
MTLGVIGGLGPLATACYLELIIRMTEAKRDQDHIDMILYNCPHIPDRTEYILGRSEESPAPEMIRIGQALARQGVDYIGIPCITAHYFHRELTENISVPIIHAIHETGEELSQNGIRKVGVMATDGTVQSGLFQEHLREMGIDVILPDERHQRYVMEIIYDNVKAGTPVDLDKFHRASAHLLRQGAQINILGCTELSLVKKDYPIGREFLDAMEVLAQRSVRLCGGKLKEKYRNLIEI